MPHVTKTNLYLDAQDLSYISNKTGELVTMPIASDPESVYEAKRHLEATKNYNALS